MRVCGTLMGVIVALGLLAGCGGGRDFIGANEADTFTEFNAVKFAQRGRRRKDRKNRNKKTVPPPQISNAAINPTSLEFFGGTVQVRADIKSKKKKFLTVSTVVTRRNDSQTFAVPLSKIKRKTYGGDVSVPPNQSNSPQTYNVDVQAQNSRAVPDTPVTERAGSFSVRGILAPPDPPPD